MLYARLFSDPSSCNWVPVSCKSTFHHSVQNIFFIAFRECVKEKSSHPCQSVLSKRQRMTSANEEVTYTPSMGMWVNVTTVENNNTFSLKWEIGLAVWSGSRITWYIPQKTWINCIKQNLYNHICIARVFTIAKYGINQCVHQQINKQNVTHTTHTIVYCVAIQILKFHHLCHDGRN